MAFPIFVAFLKFHQKLRAPYLGEAYSIRVRIRFFLIFAYLLIPAIFLTSPFFNTIRFDFLSSLPLILCIANAIAATFLVMFGKRNSAVWFYIVASSAIFFLLTLILAQSERTSNFLDVLTLFCFLELSLAAMISERRRFLVTIWILTVVSAFTIPLVVPCELTWTSWTRFFVLLTLATAMLLFIQSISKRAIDVAERAQDRLLKMNQSLDQQVKARTQHLEETLDQLQNAQDALYKREKLASLGEFVSSIVHEVNNPLSAILSASGYLQQNAQNLPQASIQLLPQLQEDEIEALFEILERCPIVITLEPSSQLLERKRSLKATLEAWNLPASEYLPQLVEIGLNQLAERWKFLFERPVTKKVLELLSNYLMVVRATSLIQEAAEKASKFVVALKRFVHKEVNQEERRPYSIVQSIENVLLLFQAQFKSGIKLEWQKTEIESLWGYPDEIMQIWFNLINNAVQAMDGKGTLTVSVEQRNEDIIVSITDSGPGIPEEYQKRIYEPFFTTKPAGVGTGLGLGIVNEVVKKHGGSMTFVSRPGKTTFNVKIPTKYEPVFY